MTGLLSPPNAQSALTVLQDGYDGACSPQTARLQTLWRVGRWLRIQGAGRPATLHRADDGAIVVNGQILTIDAHGQIQNLSTMRRSGFHAACPQRCAPDVL